MRQQIHEGYYMVDHRASPGLPEDLYPGRGEGTYFEAKTNHCNHCGTIVIMNPQRTRERAFCSKCNMYVCDECGLEMKLPDYQHVTYKQSIDNKLNEIILKEINKYG